MGSTIKRGVSTRAGYEYQDLVGIKILIDHFRDPNLYEWVQIESDDGSFSALEDVVALRKDGLIEFFQVKFTVNQDEYFLDWEWLLKTKGKGSSMLSKWVKSFFRAKSQGRLYRAQLITNRIPSATFKKNLDGDFINIDKAPEDVRNKVEIACGSIERAREFFREFAFLGEQPDLNHYEHFLQDCLVPSDTSLDGWLLLQKFVRNCAIQKHTPHPDGKIRREHLVQIITKRRLQPISQDFYVPPGYQVPSKSFDKAIRTRIKTHETPITILWAAPGQGKSTYLSCLVQDLQNNGELVLRHHYFLSSDSPGTNRTSYFDIATSIVDQLTNRYPKIKKNITADVKDLHAYLADAARILSNEGKRLFLVIDGLDHVWRDTSRMDQLNNLFNVLLPLPANVSLLVGTQRVPDEQLPGKLLTNTKETDWFEVPRMDEVAVHQWIKFQDTERPMILRVRGQQKRSDALASISSSLFEVSQGHPLYLIYALGELVRTGKEINADKIKDLPPCPDGDIRSYYKALWVRLSATARNILHALAGSEFFWTDLGIRKCFGDFSEIDFLLEPRNAGMIPFHPSIFAYVRDMPDHSKVYAALLPNIVSWLETQAPEYWRWGWLWLAQAEMDNFKPLLEGVCRDWVVSSLVKGWPERQIIKILAAAETVAFEQGNFPQTVRLQSLKNRVLNAREFQSGDYGQFWATALTVSDNHQQALILIDDLRNLSPDEIVSIIRLGPVAMRKEIAEAGLKELGQRVNAWVELRHRPEHEVGNLPDCLISAAAFVGTSVVSRVLRYLRGSPNPDLHCNEYIELLGASQDIKALLAVRRRMFGEKCSQQRRLIQEHILRLTLFKGANPRPFIKAAATDLTPFVASWLVHTGATSDIGFCASSLPKEALSQWHAVEHSSGISQYFYDFFWSAFCISLQAKGDFSLLYPFRETGELGWLEKALTCLEDVARGIVAGSLQASYSTVYVAADALESPDTSDLNKPEGTQFHAFKNCLPNIALDLHLLGLTNQHQPQISAEEFSRARQTLHWVNELWINQNMNNRLPLLDKPTAGIFIQEMSSAISSEVSEFNERSDQWTQLASLASLYDVQDPTSLLRRAADCLIGYGWRKDLKAMDVLDAIQQTHAIDSSRTEEWISTITPIVAEITNFTDGDETNHVQSKLINTVAATIPGYLASFYTHHISRDEWHYADKTLEAALGVIDLSSKTAAGLSGTLLDDQTLQVLERRGRNEPVVASLLQKQIDFLGRSQPMVGATEQDKEDLRSEEKSALQQDPTIIQPENFEELMQVVSDINFPDQYRVKFFQKWLYHWQSQGKAIIALNSIRNLFDKGRYFGASEILDQAFEVSLAEEGREAAYPWLVKAHIYRNGWQTFWTSEEEIMARLTSVARIYPEKWQNFIRSTSGQAPYLRHPGHGFFIGYKYLVRFLLLAGQTDIALAVTDEFVKTLVSEVRDQPISDASWLRNSNNAELAYELLFDRLNWPVPFVRWRAARAIRDLLNNVTTRDDTTRLLLRNLEASPTESETCSLLTIILLTDPANRPIRADVVGQVRNPSVLSDSLLHQIYATELETQSWCGAHSCQVPNDFEVDKYFHKHKKAHVPPALFDNLKSLESQTGMPFLHQWAFEWKQLRDRLGTRLTGYPHYFDDISEMHRGIIGQYHQRQHEIYRSAYCRVLALAVEQMWISVDTARKHCYNNIPLIAGLFEIDPGRRPTWLADIPEHTLATGSDLQDIVHDLVRASCTDTQTMVSLQTPFHKDVAPYGHLSVKTFFVTDDFRLGSDNNLYEPSPFIPLFNQFDLRGKYQAFPVNVIQEGSEGYAIPICVTLFPEPFGYWMGDYFSIGLSSPASYYLPRDTILQCSSSGLELNSAGSTVACTRIWHDNWSPHYPRGGHTRCGVVTFMDTSELTKAQAKIGHRLGWFIEEFVWSSENNYGEFTLNKRRTVVINS